MKGADPNNPPLRHGERGNLGNLCGSAWSCVKLPADPFTSTARQASSAELSNPATRLQGSLFDRPPRAAGCWCATIQPSDFCVNCHVTPPNFTTGRSVHCGLQRHDAGSPGPCPGTRRQRHTAECEPSLAVRRDRRQRTPEPVQRCSIHDDPTRDADRASNLSGEPAGCPLGTQSLDALRATSTQLEFGSHDEQSVRKPKVLCACLHLQSLVVWSFSDRDPAVDCSVSEGFSLPIRLFAGFVKRLPPRSPKPPPTSFALPPLPSLMTRRGKACSGRPFLLYISANRQLPERRHRRWARRSVLGQ